MINFNWDDCEDGAVCLRKPGIDKFFNQRPGRSCRALAVVVPSPAMRRITLHLQRVAPCRRRQTAGAAEDTLLSRLVRYGLNRTAQHRATSASPVTATIGNSNRFARS
jgi:hypothetical protein